MRKQKAVLILLLVGMVLITGCAGDILNTVTAEQQKIFDNPSRIAERTDSYTYFVRSGSVRGDTADIAFETFYGMETWWILNSNGDQTVTVDAVLDISDGRFKLVLITEDNKVEEIIGQSQKDSAAITVPNGRNRIKAVGDNATGSINIKLSDYEDVSVTTN
ncbi:hypothetical protein [Dethiobacter alkaliphilus]|uniref:hypothetical protein n=1 Tax=Dethiobacter alkaliphilus TaxID=427926 RepID=UPI002226B69E|nr:hypothetical protein [Dethiobacter alkaliphilus]MCW3490646.1 hypothetical protein [Dethiobacter alkaliphilus]